MCGVLSSTIQPDPEKAMPEQKKVSCFYETQGGKNPLWNVLQCIFKQLFQSKLATFTYFDAATTARVKWGETSLQEKQVRQLSSNANSSSKVLTGSSWWRCRRTWFLLCILPAFCQHFLPAGPANRIKIFIGNSLKQPDFTTVCRFHETARKMQPPVVATARNRDKIFRWHRRTPNWLFLQFILHSTSAHVLFHFLK